MEQLFSYLARASVHGSKSTALNPAHWLLALVLAATILAVRQGAPSWLVTLLAVLSAVAFVLDFGAYVYLLLTNPDALRSERFTLEKMRLEKGIIGDTLSGFKEVEAGQVVATLPTGSTEEPEQ